MTISVGIAMFGRKPRGSSEGVLVAADQAMYTAKQGGRDRIALFRDPSETQQGAGADQDDDGPDP